MVRRASDVTAANGSGGAGGLSVDDRGSVLMTPESLGRGVNTSGDFRGDSSTAGRRQSLTGGQDGWSIIENTGSSWDNKKPEQDPGQCLRTAPLQQLKSTARILTVLLVD